MRSRRGSIAVNNPTIAPGSGPISGINQVSIAGSGFIGFLSVTFGGIAALFANAISDTQIFCAPFPVLAGETVSVVVTLANGTTVSGNYTFYETLIGSAQTNYLVNYTPLFYSPEGPYQGPDGNVWIPIGDVDNQGTPGHPIALFVMNSDGLGTLISQQFPEVVSPPPEPQIPAYHEIHGGIMGSNCGWAFTHHGSLYRLTPHGSDPNDITITGYPVQNQVEGIRTPTDLKIAPNGDLWMVCYQGDYTPIGSFLWIESSQDPVTEQYFSFDGFSFYTFCFAPDGMAYIDTEFGSVPANNNKLSVIDPADPSTIARQIDVGFWFFQDLQWMPNGKIWGIAYTAENVVHILAIDPETDVVEDLYTFANPGFDAPDKMIYAGDGCVYIDNSVETNRDSSIYKFDLAGTLLDTLTTVGSHTNDDTNFRYTIGIATDSNGNPCVGLTFSSEGGNAGLDIPGYVGYPTPAGRNYTGYMVKVS